MEQNNEQITEEWREILYHNRYDVSNLGNFRYRADKGTRVVKPYRGASGYLFIQIGGKAYSAHRLVAKNFCLRASDDKIVTHLNGIKTDNRAEKLYLCKAPGKTVISIMTQKKYVNLSVGCEEEGVNYRSELQRISTKSKYCRFMYW